MQRAKNLYLKVRRRIEPRKILGIMLMVIVPSQVSVGQSHMIIDHNCTDLTRIPQEWTEKAKDNLHIAYGHTSHGSQLISGMEAINNFYADGQFQWSNTNTKGKLHIFEGDGYGDGYMNRDCGYDGWADKTRKYLNAHPKCNVVIWSWCGQVNNYSFLNGLYLDYQYFRPMEKLEKDYPGVKFVYMTGHLEGLGPDGTVYKANQRIREYCIKNKKILFDFADIEKYSPSGDINYQEFNADDQCNYDHPQGERRNWAREWIEKNPHHLYTQIAQKCKSCAHSQNINCIQKGAASWWLWARLAGWQGRDSNIASH